MNLRVCSKKYIEFYKVDEKPKTSVFEVRAKEFNVLLGYVKWFGRWRQYAFYPEPDTVYEKTCLTDITDFLKELMNEHQQLLRSHRKALAEFERLKKASKEALA